MICCRPRGRLGALKVQPVTPRAGEAAHRVLVQGRATPARLWCCCRRLFCKMRQAGQAQKPKAVLRHGAALAFA